MKRAVQSALRLGAEGIRITCAGRLGGAEIARTEWYREGRVPLHTLRGNVDYAEAQAHTAYGVCGVKVWVFKGEILGHDPLAQDRLMMEAQTSGVRPARDDRPLRNQSTCCNPSAPSSARPSRAGSMATPRAEPSSTSAPIGLKAMEPERITARQIEAARRAITRHIKRAGRLWIRIFPDVPVSSKPAEVRMGSGKGSPEFWVARVKPGRILFELDGVPGPLAKTAFERAAEKLPIKTKVVARLGETLVEED